MRRVLTAILFGLVGATVTLLPACNRKQSAPSNSPMVSASLPGANHAVAAAAASPADDGNWVMPGKDYAATRFSGLNQITPANVGKLAVSFTFSTATTHGYEAPPLVVNGTMYLITPFPNDVYALDLTKPGAPTKWVF
jgi:glucose dehydrogenase